jgi:hypothetical protein
MVMFKKDEKRNDYEVIDQSGRTHGFIWQYDENWLCRVGERSAEKFDSYESAAERARSLVNEVLNQSNA